MALEHIPPPLFVENDRKHAGHHTITYRYHLSIHVFTYAKHTLSHKKHKNSERFIHVLRIVRRNRHLPQHVRYAKVPQLNGDQRTALRETREIRRTHETHETDKTYKKRKQGEDNEQTETDSLQVRTSANARRNQLAGGREPASRQDCSQAARIPLRDDSHRLQPSDRPDCRRTGDTR